MKKFYYKCIAFKIQRLDNYVYRRNLLAHKSGACDCYASVLTEQRMQRSLLYLYKKNWNLQFGSKITKCRKHAIKVIYWRYKAKIIRYCISVFTIRDSLCFFSRQYISHGSSGTILLEPAKKAPKTLFFLTKKNWRQIGTFFKTSQRNRRCINGAILI
jgi:hypothetical protein